MELVFIIIFLVCLLIATIGLSNIGILGNEPGTPLYNFNKDDDFNYSSLENRVSEAALKYYKDKYYSTSSDTLVVSVNTLKNNGYLTSIKDGKNKECTGYAKILTNGTCVSYIKCSKYKTSGYDSDYE